MEQLTLAVLPKVGHVRALRAKRRIEAAMPNVRVGLAIVSAHYALDRQELEDAVAEWEAFAERTN